MLDDYSDEELAGMRATELALMPPLQILRDQSEHARDAFAYAIGRPNTPPVRALLHYTLERELGPVTLEGEGEELTVHLDGSR